jgi:hypothetical protein
LSLHLKSRLKKLKLSKKLHKQILDQNYQKNILEQNKKLYQTQNFINSNNIINHYNSVLAQLDLFYSKEIYLNLVLDNLINISRPNGLYFTNFSFKKNINGTVQASISGVSNTRDDLLIFKKNIEENAEIKGLMFSQDSWVSPKDVKFSFTYDISK